VSQCFAFLCQKRKFSFPVREPIDRPEGIPETAGRSTAPHQPCTSIPQSARCSCRRSICRRRWTSHRRRAAGRLGRLWPTFLRQPVGCPPRRRTVEIPVPPDTATYRCGVPRTTPKGYPSVTYYTGNFRLWYARPLIAEGSLCPAITRTPSSIRATTLSAVQACRKAMPFLRQAARTRSRALCISGG